jgi:hypothetical protein
MRVAFVLVAALLLAGSAMAADVAKGPEYIEGTVVEYTDSNSRGDVLIVNLIDGTFTDQSPVYASAFAANGKTADVVYDPAGAWPDMSGYTTVLVSSSDMWWGYSFGWTADLAAAGSYIDGGGCLWLVGQDFLYSAAGEGMAFAMNYLGLASVVEDVNYNDEGPLEWFGTAGGPLDGLYAAMVPCFASNPWFTDDVTPVGQGLCDWSSSLGSGQGGSVTDFYTMFSVVEFACDPTTINDVVGALLEGVCGGVIPVEESSWGTIKHDFR